MFRCDLGISKFQEKLEGSTCNVDLYVEIADELVCQRLSSQELQTKLKSNVSLQALCETGLT